MKLETTFRWTSRFGVALSVGALVLTIVSSALMAAVGAGHLDPKWEGREPVPRVVSLTILLVLVVGFWKLARSFTWRVVVADGIVTASSALGWKKSLPLAALTDIREEDSGQFRTLVLRASTCELRVVPAPHPNSDLASILRASLVEREVQGS
jgi:hypothetical protein